MAADHAAEAGTAVPAAANLALDKQVAVFVADGDATAAAITLVAGTKRAGEPGGGGARVGIGNANGLHWIRKKEAGKGIKGGGYDMGSENIFNKLSEFSLKHCDGIFFWTCWTGVWTGFWTAFVAYTLY